MKDLVKAKLKYLIRPLFFTICICVFYSKTNAQKQIDPTYLSVADGIGSPTVHGILQDSYGLIWITTLNGLQKYDGYRYETFKNIPGNTKTIQSNVTWCLMEDAHHDIWVGNDLGISRYNREKNEFINYLFQERFNVSGSSAGRTFRIMQDSQGIIWAATALLELLRYEPATDQWELARYDTPGNRQEGHSGISFAVTEDHKGGLWSGSASYGLMHRSKNEKIFKRVPFDKAVIDFSNEADRITDLFADVQNTLWITTNNGIYKYYPATGRLRTIAKYQESRLNTYNQWNGIVQDAAGNVWIANNYRGMLKFDGITDRFEEIPIAGKTKMGTKGWNITLTDMMIDRSGIFWFGSKESGLLKYDPVTKPFSFYSHDGKNPLSMTSGVYGILASKVKSGIVYVGTKGTGFDIFDPKTQTFKQITFKAADDMYGGSVRSLAEENDGTLWLGTWGDGLIKLNENYRELARYKYKSKTSGFISDNKVRVIKKDRSGKLWIGTSNGLDIFDPAKGSFQKVASKDSRSYPQSLIEEVDKWGATNQKVAGIEKVKDVQNLTQRVEIKSAGRYAVMTVGEGDALGNADYGWIENAAKDTVWKMGDYNQTFYAGGAAKNRIEIQQIDLKPGSYSLRYSSDDSHSYGKFNEEGPDLTSLYGILLIKLTEENQASLAAILSGKLDKEFILGGNIYDIEIGKKYAWISSGEVGLNQIDLATGKVKTYVNDPNNKNSLSNNVIWDIYEDSNGMIWLATNEGMNIFNPNTRKFIRYSVAEGLPTNIISAILPGENGEMWIATENGLSRMVTNEALGKVTFINYNAADGLGGDSFLALAAAKASDGRYYFGREHGLTTFASIKANNTPPEIIISNLLISNKSVLEMKEESPVKGSLLEAKSIVLSFDQNNISFEFAALHFANPLKNQYAHMLKGYDKDWIYDNRNFAAYTNLDPGEYEFLIRASNAYGVWNEKEKTIKIMILPPWWQTWWAYGTYIFLFVLAVVGINLGMQRRIKLKEREHSREKELQQAKEIEKAYTTLQATQNQLIQSEKMASLGELAAGIAHEIKNPLNFINNFSETSAELLEEMKAELENGNLDIAKELADDVINNLEIISNHGKRADSIVKGMLQHSRGSNSVKELTDVNALVDEYVRLAFHALRAKDQTFNATIRTDFDKTFDKIEIIPQDIGRVILNLLNNAFYSVQQKQKEFPDSDYKPTVTVNTQNLADKISIRIQDNGNGIPQNLVDKIFQPFFTTKPSGQGTGLGLSLSYDIVTKGHSGHLGVETEVGEGSVFVITLPK